jgi:hypothetical protein
VRSALRLALVVALGSAACQKSTPSAGDDPPSQAADIDKLLATLISGGAQQQFGAKFSCPDDRVAVKMRPDIDPARALASKGDPPPAVPPDEVRNDPGRYAKWQEDQQVHGTRAIHARYTMLEVAGCGHTQIVGCRNVHGGRGRGDWIDCIEATYGK